MKTVRDAPLDTWMVVEPVASDEVKPVSTHATQQEAEAECSRRNRGLRHPRYNTCIMLQPIAERMGRAVRLL